MQQEGRYSRDINHGFFLEYLIEQARRSTRWHEVIPIAHHKLYRGSGTPEASNFSHDGMLKRGPKPWRTQPRNKQVAENKEIGRYPSSQRQKRQQGIVSGWGLAPVRIGQDPEGALRSA